jgi:hypothetical protein
MLAVTRTASPVRTASARPGVSGVRRWSSHSRPVLVANSNSPLLLRQRLAAWPGCGVAAPPTTARDNRPAIRFRSPLAAVTDMDGTPSIAMGTLFALLNATRQHRPRYPRHLGYRNTGRAASVSTALETLCQRAHGRR